MKTNKPCERPCRECPFRRDSAPGWIGAYPTPEDLYRRAIDAEQRFPCHMAVDWDASQGEVEQQLAAAPQCAGALAHMKNCSKMPRPGSPVAYDAAEAEKRDDVFTWKGEFLKHHGSE